MYSLADKVLSICDIQEKFRPAIWELDKVILTASKLLRAAQVLQIPVFVTTQNAARLGDTVQELAPFLKDDKSLVKAVVDKTRFSMWVPEISAQLQSNSSKAQIAIVGIESHICCTQTALDALAAGHQVYIIADGVSSVNKEEVGIALARLRGAGAVVTTSESWLYECMGDAHIPEFKDIVKLVKESSKDTQASLAALQPVSARI
jgi:nicotinamidase-related amidase